MRGWSVARVNDFLSGLSLVDDAFIARAQQERIDGDALLLCTCHELTKRLQLRLGPALKLENILRCIKHQQQHKQTNNTE